MKYNNKKQHEMFPTTVRYIFCSDYCLEIFGIFISYN